MFKIKEDNTSPTKGNREKRAFNSDFGSSFSNKRTCLPSGNFEEQNKRACGGLRKYFLN